MRHLENTGLTYLIRFLFSVFSETGLYFYLRFSSECGNLLRRLFL